MTEFWHQHDQGVTQKLHKKFKTVETYWNIHSLESSWEALSDAAISFAIHPFSGKMHFLFFFYLKNLGP
jgi:hypothetical protein